jgi:glycosyltransferase involved in cell wall biosynthesis
MRVLFLDHSSHAAGAAMSLRYLAAGLVQRGHEVHVAMLWPSPELDSFYESAGLVLHPLRGFPTIPHTTAGWLRLSSPRSFRAGYRILRGYPKAAAGLRSLVERLKPDIVHLNSATLLSGAVALRKSPPAIVWHVRESPPFDGRGMRRRLVANTMKKTAAETIFISEHDKAMWSRGRFGTVIYCCTPTGGGDPQHSPAELRKALGLRPEHRVILFVGGFQEIKGFQVLCRAFEARRYGPYVGIHSYHDRCQRLLQSRILQERCVVRSLVPNVADYLAICEFLVFPSVRPHFARPVIEAALAGKPSVASRFDGIAEVVSEGDGALLVPPGDAAALAAAMEKMLADPEGATRMGERAREFAGEKFSVARHIEAIETVYRKATLRAGRVASA